jgi:hypothetical protein
MTVGMSLCSARHPLLRVLSRPPTRRAIPTAGGVGRVNASGGWYKALIAAFDVASGKVRGTIGDTRTEADFVSILDNLFASAPPAGGWSATPSTLTSPNGKLLVA